MNGFFGNSPTRAAVIGVLALAVSMTSGCFFESTTGPVVYEPAPTVVVPGPAMVVGDLSMSYDFGGWNCWDLGVTDISFEVYDSAGFLVAEDWGLPCNVGAQIRLFGLPLDDYFVAITAFDAWNMPAYAFDGVIVHASPHTAALLTLY